ncbi:MAG: 23S rRNA (uracil(1939)-C(5))-methyltransferase RlmD [Methylococcaceae bacterium]|nr:MAG: 23S rRNA (uracil(1939)-C(5))-methyltransferase RlmD [Methylococcaceae bacterium]
MSRRNYQRKPLPKDARAAVIDSLNHDGRGVARVDGKVVFIDGALPGETIHFIYSKNHRDYAEGRVAAIVTASSERIQPHCPNADICGGCSLQHLTHEAQIHHKQTLLLEQLRRIGKVEPAQVFAPIRGPLWGYRHRARLSVKDVRKKGQLLVGFREKASPFVADIQACPVLHPAVGTRLLELRALLAGLKLRELIPQIEIAVGDHRSTLVFRILDDAPPEDWARLRAFGAQHGFDIYLQRQGPDSIVPVQSDTVLPHYSLPESGLDFHYNPTEFTQVNPAINRSMVARALELLAPGPQDAVLDLFCGLGNFTLPLAQRAKAVVGVEGEMGLVRQARDNARHNGIDNVAFYATDLFQEVGQAEWAQRRYDKILLDPARAGAQEIVRQLPRFAARRVVYVSCNPATLARDAGILVHEAGYRLLGAGIMDMFPHTAHVESIALFER